MKILSKVKSMKDVDNRFSKHDPIPKKNQEIRPWGNFEQFNLNTPCTVKIISVSPHSQLSLQYHHDRSEFWKVIDGRAIIQIGDEKHIAKKDDEFIIPELIHHRISTTKYPVRILEIAYGHFDEKDIIRIHDKYDRVI